MAPGTTTCLAPCELQICNACELAFTSTSTRRRSSPLGWDKGHLLLASWIFSFPTPWMSKTDCSSYPSIQSTCGCGRLLPTSELSGIDESLSCPCLSDKQCCLETIHIHARNMWPAPGTPRPEPNLVKNTGQAGADQLNTPNQGLPDR